MPAEQSYRVQSADITYKLRALVTATNSVGSGKAKSKSSAKVIAGSPLNLAAPTISGTVLPGQTLTANDGTWVGTPPITFVYQWLSCAPLGGGCSEIPGATEQTHTVGAGEIGDSFEVVVTATNGEGKASATSPETSITGGGVQPPEDVLPPLITGLAVTGQTVSATTGLWNGTEPAFSYQWELCNAAGASCAEIPGAEEATFTIPDGDAGHTLRVIVTASNSAGTASATSEPSAGILGVGPGNTEPPAISGNPTAGQILTASSGKWTGTEPITYEYEWLRCNAGGAECTTAAAASVLPIYAVAAADVGHTLRVNVIATNIAGKGEASSEPTALVAGVPPANVIPPLIAGLTITGQTLTATEGTWTGTEPISYAFQWELCYESGRRHAKKSRAPPNRRSRSRTETRGTPARRRDRGKRRRLSRQGIGRDAKCWGSGRRTANRPPSPGSQRRPAADRLERQMDRHRTDHLRIRMAALQHGRRECTQAAGASLLPTYTVAAADVGHTLRVRVIARNIAGTGEAESPHDGDGRGRPTVERRRPARARAGDHRPDAHRHRRHLDRDATDLLQIPLAALQQSRHRMQRRLRRRHEIDVHDPRRGRRAHAARVRDRPQRRRGPRRPSGVTSEVLGVGPKNTEAPTVSGTATAGQLADGLERQMDRHRTDRLRYEWLRCNTGGAECVQRRRASLLTTYTVVPADVGHTLRVKVIAKNLAGSARAESAPTSTVAGVPPKNTIAPLIVAAPVSGIAATATEGTWEGTARSTYSFQWLHCSKIGAECSEISGATKNQYTPLATELGKTLKVRVTAKNVAGSAAAESAATIPIVL